MTSSSIIFCILPLITVTCHGSRPSLSGEPLFLTPFIQQFKSIEARTLSQVIDLPLVSSDSNVTSYSGFITVNREYNSNIFFWFFPGIDPTAPLILWLEGGPGVSSLNTLFNGNGPFVFTNGSTLIKREFSWINISNVIYVDSPVGTGFSFTQNIKGYSKNVTEVAGNLYKFLDQFFSLFPEYQSNDFYIASSGYGTKDAVALSYKIMRDGMEAFINLKGFICINPFMNPSIQISFYADHFFQSGLVDINEYIYFKGEQKKIRDLITKGDTHGAYHLFDELMTGRFSKDDSYFKTVTGHSSLHSLLDINHETDQDYYKSYVIKSETRRAIHVGDLPFYHQNDVVLKVLMSDYLNSVDDMMSSLFPNYKILFMSGNLDVLTPVASVGVSILSVKWWCQDQLIKADKEIGVWGVKDELVVGHLIRACDIYHLTIRNAGRDLIHDQEAVASTVVQMFTNESQPFRI